MRIRDWSSDVCSSDLQLRLTEPGLLTLVVALLQGVCHGISHLRDLELCLAAATAVKRRPQRTFGALDSARRAWAAQDAVFGGAARDPLTIFSLPQHSARSARRDPPPMTLTVQVTCHPATF